jgi:arylsulfatase A
MHASLMLHMLVVALCFLVSFSFADEESNNSVNNPNILLILADDVGTGDIPFYWNEKSLVQMPNLRRLASQGVKFTDAHSTPLCAPSRYMLLSGNYAQRGVFPMGSWNLNVKNENQFMSYQKSIAEVLKTDANYETAMFGKWHMGGKIFSVYLFAGYAFVVFTQNLIF